VCRDLIHGDADTEVGAGRLSRPRTGEDRGRGTGVITGTVGAGRAIAICEAADELELVPIPSTRSGDIESTSPIVSKS
jgi:hypothetical protein